MTSPHDHLLERLKKLPAEIRILIEKRIELYIIEFGEQLSKNAAKAISALATGLVFLLAVIFALIGLAFFVGDVLDSTAAGFSVVAALLLVLAMVVYLLSPDLIEHRFRDKIAATFLGSGEEEQFENIKQNQLQQGADPKSDSVEDSEYSIKHIKPN